MKDNTRTTTSGGRSFGPLFGGGDTNGGWWSSCGICYNARHKKEQGYRAEQLLTLLTSSTVSTVR